MNKTNVLLVEGPKLQEEEWGKEIRSLADLRLLHEFGNLSEKGGTRRGRRFVGFTLDLSNYTGTRSEQIDQIEFWTTKGKQAARLSRLIYEPGASDRQPAGPRSRRGAAELEAAENVVGRDAEWSQTDIFDVLGREPADEGPVSDLEPDEGIAK